MTTKLYRKLALGNIHNKIVSNIHNKVYNSTYQNPRKLFIYHAYVYSEENSRA